MIFEEYCSYIISRERDLQEFTIPGSNVKINKNELLTTMREALHDNGDKSYDRLLVNTLLYSVNKDRLGRNLKFDKNTDAVMSNIRKRVESIKTLHDSMKRPFPFSYERVFEILVYFLRLLTNILNSDKAQTVQYIRADIPPETIIYILNPKLSMDSLDAEWEEKGWEAFQKDIKSPYTSRVNNYFRFILLATYIRYCEIKDM